MNIAILGGKFDPPHIWHYWTAVQILENAKNIDQVWLLPDYNNAFKPTFASAGDRVEMLRFLETGRIRVSTAAVSNAVTTYTIEIVQELLKDVNNKFHWVVGSDTLGEFTRWRDYQKLSRLLPFLVIPRKDYPIRFLPSGFYKIEGNVLMSNVSSSIIRDRIKRGLTVSGLVFPKVEEYIKNRNLYK
jgi:nicotinate-nucleotide adenylyltransferase